MLGLGIRKAVKARLARLLGGEEPVTETRAYTTPAPVPAAKPVVVAKPPAEPVAVAKPAEKPVEAAPVATDGPVAQPMRLPPAKKVAAPEAVAAPIVVAPPVEEAPADDIVGRPFTPDAVQAVLDDMVRPALQADGGDIALVRVEDQSVYVRLVGSCSSCPSSIATMKMGVERLLMEEFPEMRALVQVE